MVAYLHFGRGRASRLIEKQTHGGITFKCQLSAAANFPDVWHTHTHTPHWECVCVCPGPPWLRYLPIHQTLTWFSGDDWGVLPFTVFAEDGWELVFHQGRCWGLWWWCCWWWLRWGCNAFAVFLHGRDENGGGASVWVAPLCEPFVCTFAVWLWLSDNSNDLGHCLNI